MTKYIVALLLVIVLFISCTTNEINKQGILIEIDDELIVLNSIDTSISEQVFKLRKQLIEAEISKLLIEKQARQKNMPYNKLLEVEIKNKSKKVTKTDFLAYIKENQIVNISTSDSLNIVSYLTSYNEKTRQDIFVDSLKYVYRVKTNLLPENLKSINLEGITYNCLNECKENKIDVYIFSDYLCPSCQKSEIILKDLVAKYNSKVNFKFVFYSNYIDKPALACEAAALQNSFVSMHELIFEKIDKVTTPNFFHKKCFRNRFRYFEILCRYK